MILIAGHPAPNYWLNLHNYRGQTCTDDTSCAFLKWHDGSNYTAPDGGNIHIQASGDRAWDCWKLAGTMNGTHYDFIIVGADCEEKNMLICHTWCNF